MSGKFVLNCEKWVKYKKVRVGREEILINLDLISWKRESFIMFLGNGVKV